MKNLLFKKGSSLKRDMIMSWAISMLGAFLVFGLAIGITGIVSVLFDWKGLEGLGNAFYVLLWTFFIGFSSLGIYNVIRSKKLINKWFDDNKLFKITMILTFVLYFGGILLFEDGEINTIISMFKYSQMDYVAKSIWETIFISSQIFLASILVAATSVVFIAEKRSR